MPNDYEALLKHPYFSGINFEAIQSIKVPLTLPQQIIENNRLNDEEDLSLDAAELN